MTKHNPWKQAATATVEPLAAGTYLVGDPCYAFDNDLDENWQGWLRSAWEDVDPNQVRILDGRTPHGQRVVASGTAYGDGTYEDQDGNQYPVDAGLLGAVHMAFLTKLYPLLAGLPAEQLEERTGMRVVTFEAPFDVSYEDGTVQIGHVLIDTDPPAEDYEETCPHCGEDCTDWDGNDCMNQDDEEED